MTLFKDRYRIASTRVPEWDYSAPALYFVTICTRDRRCTLGDIVDNAVKLSSAGEIVAEEWLATPSVRPNVNLDAWTIMPIHIHGVIVINEKTPPSVETTRRVVSDPAAPEMNQSGLIAQSRRPAGSSLQSGTLGAIIGQFKSVCTKRIRATGNQDFGWQSGFYDHIIRNERSLNRIREYIEGNASKWREDKLHPDGVSLVPQRRSNRPS